MHNNDLEDNESGIALKQLVAKRKSQHEFPKHIVYVDLDDSLFKACELMFFSYVRHLVVLGDPEETTHTKLKKELQGVVTSNMIMR